MNNKLLFGEEKVSLKGGVQLAQLNSNLFELTRHYTSHHEPAIAPGTRRWGARAEPAVLREQPRDDGAAAGRARYERAGPPTLQGVIEIFHNVKTFKVGSVDT